MLLSLSGRIAEGEHLKGSAALSFEELARLAQEIGYRALCLRPAQLFSGITDDEMQAMRATLERHGLRASMLCLHAAVAANSADASQSLTQIGRDLDVAELFSAGLIRVGLKRADEATSAQRAADEAAERGIRLAHQIHTASPFETVDECLAMLERIDRPNFGLIVEPANMALVGEEYDLAVMQRLAPYIFNVYVQNLRVDPNGPQAVDTNRGPVHYHRLAVGDAGGINFARFCAALKAVGYDGWVTSHQPSLPDQEVGALAAKVYEYLLPMIV